MSRFTILLAALLLLLAGTAFAQVPPTMSYQGVLTDAANNLLPDGFYDLTFRIYDAPAAGNLLWTEAHTAANHVLLLKGGFSVILGSLTPLNLAFDGPLYLSVQVGVDPELAPRVALASSPYAMGLRLPFTLSTTAGTPLLQGYDFFGLGTALDATSPGGTRTWSLEPDGNGSGGWFAMGRNGGATGFVVDGNSTGGDPTVAIEGSARSAFFVMGQSGDASVQLPPDAISAGEILDEPGVAQGHANGSVVVPVGATMGDIVTVTLTTPAAGYIVVQADAQHGIGGSGTATSNFAALQIDETAGGSIDAAHYFDSGYSSAVAGTQNAFRYAPISIHRTYFKAAGTYTFRLEAYAIQSEALSNYLWNPTITATFYPTSYGTVTASPAALEAGSFSNVQVTTAAGNGPGGAPVQGQLVDLRELELRAAKAKAEAEQAERTLLEARVAAQAQARARALSATPARKTGN